MREDPASIKGPVVALLCRSEIIVGAATTELGSLNAMGGRGKDGGGIGREDHFLPHKFLKRTFQRRANSTKQLL